MAKVLKHQSEFPLSIIQEVKSEPNWEAALLKKMRDIMERMLKFYLKGLCKLGVGEKGDNDVQLVSNLQELWFNYLPDGLREEETPGPRAEASKGSNFFNMEQVAVANRSVSSYTRSSLDEQFESRES